MRSRVITGVTGDVPFPACVLAKVRVGGAAALVGAVQIKRGATVLETIPAGAAPGIERAYSTKRGGGVQFDPNTGALSINMANAGDTVIVFT